MPRSLRIIDGVAWLPITKEDVLPVVRVAAGKQNDGFLYGAAVLALGIVLVPRRLVRRRRRRARSLS